MRVGNCFYGTRGGYEYVQGMHAYGFGMYFLCGIGITLIVALLFFILLHNKKKKNVDSEAEQILKTRFVNGEITKEEYAEMKKLIK